ncbi:dihydrolipoamide dehydrogenase [Sulfuricella denitrificans skB26]|uniref:Dihydrolipoyl dehydrogenase n=1 Tax=Sulfuricella denitrificans (strain DSM 22764 / NBRC 105220 / skB26) TaxID=1163617 RepID=S6AA66_SULDS|nr:dihydrolipoyl dehydrogenase [Sulfuricella denitrificans]BAN35325.1 dihydrolipoamide dehydrogenase [Sulfuricella denitrificans skB26]
MSVTYDVAVIGAGPAGYVSAIRCAQLGLNTVCIDDWKNEDGKASLGGTCLNVGCIPSKVLLESSENYERIQNNFPAHGITVEGLKLDVGTMLARKKKIVHTLTDGISVLLRKNKVAIIHGKASFTGGGAPWKLEVVQHDGKVESVEARHVIIATGSTPRQLPQVPVDNKRVVDNVGALDFKEVPKRLGIVGAGVIGLELGSVWRRLGSNVTLFQPNDTFLPSVDDQLAAEALRIFTRQGLAIHRGVKLSAIKVSRKNVAVEFENKEGVQKLLFDKLIVAIGRAPNAAGLDTDKVGLKFDEHGYIDVDEHCRTNLSNIYAIGDVVRGPMLAHKGSEEGVAVAELIAGQAGHVNYETIPWVIYTSPEIAWVGQTEQALKIAGVEYSKGIFPFSANGRAHTLQETTGLVKVLADAKTDRILGVHIIGPCASELIQEAVVAMEFASSSEDLARIVHAHPSLSESLHEAALGVTKRSIHI